MSISGVAIKVSVTAWDTVNQVGKTGLSSSTFTLEAAADGADIGAITSSGNISEDGNGEYFVILTSAQNTGTMMSLRGSNSSTGIVIIPLKWNNLAAAPYSGTPPTAAAIATAIFQDTTAGDFTVAGSIGKSLSPAVLGTAPGAAGGLFIAGSNAATTFASVAITSGYMPSNAVQINGITPTMGASLTFPTSVASPTNITAGTITTVTNLTNAPTAGDFTATMKTSLNAATPASVTGAVGSVTGNVGGISGVTFPANFSTGWISSGGVVQSQLANGVTHGGSSAILQLEFLSVTTTSTAPPITVVGASASSGVRIDVGGGSGHAIALVGGTSGTVLFGNNGGPIFDFQGAGDLLNLACSGSNAIPVTDPDGTDPPGTAAIAAGVNVTELAGAPAATVAIGPSAGFTLTLTNGSDPNGIAGAWVAGGVHNGKNYWTKGGAFIYWVSSNWQISGALGVNAFGNPVSTDGINFSGQTSATWSASPGLATIGTLTTLIGSDASGNALANATTQSLQATLANQVSQGVEALASSAQAGALPASIDAQLSGTHGSGTWGPSPPGAAAKVIQCKNTGGQTITGAQVVSTSDAAGQDTIAGPFTSDAQGNAPCYLALGLNYIWVFFPGENFSNPTPYTVT